MRTVCMSGVCSLGGMAELLTMRAHQVLCGLFVDASTLVGALSLKCDVNGALDPWLTSPRDNPTRDNLEACRLGGCFPTKGAWQMAYCGCGPPK